MTPRQPPSKRGPGAKPGRMCRARSRRFHPCQPSPSPVGSVPPSTRSRRSGRAGQVLRPLDPVYDWDRLRAEVTRERIASGPPSIWRYADLLPVDAPAEPRLAPGFTPLVPAPRLAEEVGVAELWLKLDTANPTHSFKDRVVAVAARKAQELGFETLSCSSTGNLAGAVAARAAAEGLEAVVFVPADLEPEKLAAAAAYGPTLYAVDGHYDHCSRLTIELSFELPWGFVNVNLRSYYAEGSKTLGYEIAEQLAWRPPDVVAALIASGALFHKVGQGFSDLRSLSAGRRAIAAARRRAGGGLSAGRDRVPRGDDRDARASELDRPLARDRQPGGRRLRRRDRARDRAARSTRCRRTRSGRTWRSLRARPACSARPRRG